MARDRRYNADTGEYDEDPYPTDAPLEDAPLTPRGSGQPTSDTMPVPGDKPPFTELPPGDSARADSSDNAARVRQEYQSRFGRDPSTSEMASEQENLTKYGWDTGPQGGVKAQIAKRAMNTPGQDSGGSSAMASAYGTYLGTPAVQGPAGAQAPAAGNSELLAYLTQMRDQQQSDRTRQDSERAAMRALLMERIGKAGAPVDPNDPGIKGQLAAQHLSRQRSAERQQSQAAVRLAGEGLGDSGALDTTLAGIEQHRGEGESADIADVMGQEHQAKRQELMSLLQQAVSMGDAESARNLQQQIAAIDATLQQQGQSDVMSRFGADLGFRKSSFLDDLGYRLAALQMGGNERAAGYF